MRAWWQKSDIEAKIDEVKKLGKGVDSTWKLDALEEIKDLVVAKEEKAQSGSDKERKDAKNEGIELVTGFQLGVKAKFYTFAPGKDKGDQDPIIVREKLNKDPRGKYPIDAMYGDTDGSNPLGRSIVDLVGGLQNLIDSDMQMYQYNRALMLAPPVVKRGKFNKARIRWAPNIIIDVGNDPNAKVEPLTIDTTAIENYPALYGLQKSQLLNLLSSPDTSISAEIGNPGFSKTPKGIDTQNANISVDDNYVRKMFETWFENWSETAINIYFAERTGVEELQLDQETADKLRDLAAEGKFDLTQLSDDNKIRINYDTATPALRFEVDASTSKMQDDKKQQEGLTGLLTALDQSPVLAQIITQKYPEKVLAVWNGIVAASGVEDPEKIKVDIKKFQQEMQQAQSTASQGQGEPAQAKPPSMSVNYKDAPEDIKRQMEAADGFTPSSTTSPVQAQVDQKQQDLALKADQQAHQQAIQIHQVSQPDPNQPQISPVDQQIIDQLHQLNVPEEKIQQALVLLENGRSEQEVMQIIGLGQGVPA